MAITTNPNDPELRPGIPDEAPRDQSKSYLVLSPAMRAADFLQPVRTTYKHKTCDTTTTMSMAIAETYALDPWFYSSTYCVHCRMHRALTEFVWHPDNSEVSASLWSEEMQNFVAANIADRDIARKREAAGIKYKAVSPPPLPHEYPTSVKQDGTSHVIYTWRDGTTERVAMPSRPKGLKV